MQLIREILLSTQFENLTLILKRVLMITFFLISFFALIALKTEMGIDILPNLNTSLDDLAYSIFDF